MKYQLGRDDKVKVRCIAGVPGNPDALPIVLNELEEIDENQKMTVVEEVEGEMVEIVPGARYRTNHYITHQYKIIKIKQRYIDEELYTDVYIEEEPYVPPPKPTPEELAAY